MKGFRQPPQGSKNDVIRNLQVEAQNNTLAIRMSQMMLKRVLDDSQNMGRDIGGALTQIAELQYQFGALVKTLGLDPALIAATANEQRLVDFNEGAAKADEQENLIVADVVGDDSTIVLTSTTDDGPDTGIFRSRIKLSDAGVPALSKGLAGQPVGTTLDVELGGKVHHVELLAIRNPVAAAPVDVTPASQTEVAVTVN